MIVTAIGIAILALIGFWRFGDVLLRAGGLIIIVLAVLNLAMVGNPAVVLLLVVGLVLWLGGHWHYALRHHAYTGQVCARGPWFEPRCAHFLGCAPRDGRQMTPTAGPRRSWGG